MNVFGLDTYNNHLSTLNKSQWRQIVESNVPKQFDASGSKKFALPLTTDQLDLHLARPVPSK